MSQCFVMASINMSIYNKKYLKLKCGLLLRQLHPPSICCVGMCDELVHWPLVVVRCINNRYYINYERGS